MMTIKNMTITGKRSITLLILAGLIVLVLQKITFVMSESISSTLLWQSQGGIGLGDYVNYSLDEKKLPEELKHLARDGQLKVTKQVVCNGDQHFKTHGLDYFCDDRYLGSAKTTSRQGNPLVPFIFNGKVPLNQVFLIGEHKDSFDSRYWGFVDRSDLTRVVPIF